MTLENENLLVEVNLNAQIRIGGLPKTWRWWILVMATSITVIIPFTTQISFVRP